MKIEIISRRLHKRFCSNMLFFCFLFFASYFTLQYSFTEKVQWGHNGLNRLIYGLIPRPFSIWTYDSAATFYVEQVYRYNDHISTRPLSMWHSYFGINDCVLLATTSSKALKISWWFMLTTQYFLLLYYFPERIQFSEEIADWTNWSVD